MGRSKSWQGAMTPDGGGQTSAPKLGRGPAGPGAPANVGGVDRTATTEGSSESSTRRAAGMGNAKSTEKGDVAASSGT
jgi:hypothetical protein